MGGPVGGSPEGGGRVYGEGGAVGGHTTPALTLPAAQNQLHAPLRLPVETSIVTSEAAAMISVLEL